MLQRETVNWNTQFLEGRIRTLLASLENNHDINSLTISFSATHTHVIVTPPQTDVVNRFLWMFSSVKKFAVVKAIWPYANIASEQLNDVSRQCAVQSEDDWWRVWRPIIAMAVVRRKRGWLCAEDVMDMAMCLRSGRSKLSNDITKGEKPECYD